MKWQHKALNGLLSALLICLCAATIGRAADRINTDLGQSSGGGAVAGEAMKAQGAGAGEGKPAMMPPAAKQPSIEAQRAPASPVINTRPVASSAVQETTSPSASPQPNPLLTTVLWSALAAVVAAALTALLSRSTKISEFRQAWIIDLRKDIADYLGSASEWRRWNASLHEMASTPERALLMQEKLYPLEQQARVLLWRIKLRFNPRPNRFKEEDDTLLACLDCLLDRDRWKSGSQADWESAAECAEERARELLKREWEVTKRLLPPKATVAAPVSADPH